MDDSSGDRIRRRDFTMLSVGTLSATLAGCAGVLDDGGGESDGEPTPTAEQTDATTDQEPRGELAGVDVSPSAARQGEPVTVSAAVANAGDVTFRGELDVAVGSESVLQDRVSVAAGATESVTVTTQQWQPGTYDVAVVLSADGDELGATRTSVDVDEVHEEFVGVSGTNLVVDGQPLYYSGGHADGLSTQRTAGDDPGAFDYEYEDEFDGEHYVADFMQYAASMDANVLRIVAAGVPYWEDSTIHDAPGEFNEEWFDLLDTVVAEAKRNGVRLVISPLSHDDTYAPAPAVYAKWSDTVDDDLNADELNDAFFHDEQANQYYKNFLERLITRENTVTGVEYRNDPTIMMWECGNETNYWLHDNVGDSLADWYDDIATYIKSLDDNHLVTTGMYGSDERNEYVEDHRSDAIDVCSFHFYPKFPNGPYEGDTYREDPATDLSVEEQAAYIESKVETAHTELEKPVVLGEYGIPQFPDIYGWSLETRREYFSAMYETADRVDLDGVHAFALVLDKKFTGETRITNGRYENGIYPDDDLVPIIDAYGDVVAEKSTASVTGER